MPRNAKAVGSGTTPSRGAGAADIDQVLGDSARRYFGSGYRRVTHALRDLCIGTAPESGGRIDAIADVDYPADWSDKAEGVELRPHLSSIDTLVLGAQLCESYLVHRYVLDAEQHRRMWLRRFAIKTGSSPVENFDGLAVNAVVKRSVPTDGAYGDYVSSFECTLGLIGLTCEIEHAVTDAPAIPGECATEELLLGPRSERYYGEAHRTRAPHIGDLRISDGNTRVEALVTIVAERATYDVPALDAAYQPAVSMLDSIVVTAQLSQVLLYRLDGLEREQTDTMWLRRVMMSSQAPYRPMRNGFVASVDLVRDKVLTVGGERWRTADMVAHCQGIDSVHSLAHKIPAKDRRVR